ncbi:MAG TPA: hypothetical protein VL993_19770 [Stellaceae bacterium]|nr:hypothetical protein [Stellaceae bacterium]
MPAALELRTMGHASLVLAEKGSHPILLTDPWLVGSVYWRSWWLQHYPNEAELDWLARSETVYVTHEHPDHFHMPSIRRLGTGPRYLFPELAERGFLAHMAQHGFRAEILPALTWRPIGDGLSILSIPAWNDDSLLLIETPGALILNLNDAKPLPPVLKAIRRLVDRVGKPTVMACSYSPASLINSFSGEHGNLHLKTPAQYVDYVCRTCDRLGADYYVPFASQAEFRRDDSLWANEYRTTYQDLERYWRCRARLLPPYVTLDLQDFSHSAVPPDRYRGALPATLARLTQVRETAERDAIIDDDDVAGLRRKLNAFRLLWMLLFRRGFVFALGERRFKYAPWRGTLEEADADAGDFVVTVPKLAMKEAIRNNHVSDLGITMFVRVRLHRAIDVRKVYGMFVLFAVDDYRHLAGAKAFWHWIRTGIRHSVGLKLPAPAPDRG